MLLKNFFYKTIKGTEIKLRKVLLIAEDNEYIQGFDIKYLTEAEIDYIKQEFKDWNIKNPYCWNIETNGELGRLQRKAIRTFRKDHIIIKKIKLDLE